MEKFGFSKFPYENPRIDCLSIVVEEGFAISNENGAGSGWTGGFGEFDASNTTGNITPGESWETEGYEG